MHRPVVQDKYHAAWDDALAKFCGEIGSVVRYTAPFDSRSEFGVIDDVDDKWVYVLYETGGGPQATCPINLQIDK